MTDSVFVLGAGGFIGRALCMDFAANGWKVYAGTRRAVHFSNARILNVVSPFNSLEHFGPAVARCAVIVHAASHTTPSSSAAQPQLDGNLRSTLALVESLQNFPGRRLIYLSSGGALYEERSGPVDEEVPLLPRSYHGAGKAAAEHFIQAWVSQCDGLACILRPSNVYGPGQPPRVGFGIIPAAFNSISIGKPLQIWGDGSIIRDYLYIDDMASLCTRALSTRLPKRFNVFNASHGCGTSLRSLLLKVEKIAGRPLDRQHLPPRSVDMSQVVPDNTRARRQFEWRPSTGLDIGLAHTWRWFKRSYA